MTAAEDGGRLRVALLLHSYGDPSPADAIVAALASALSGLGHEPAVLAVHRGPTTTTTANGVRVVRYRRLPEAPLRVRGFTGPLTQLPWGIRALGGFDLAHAFTPVDAWVAQRWRRRGGGPVVYTASEPLTRDRLADARMRLDHVRAAVEDSDSVTAASEEARAALRRWLAVDAPLLAPADGAEHVAVYRDVLARRRR